MKNLKYRDSSSKERIKILNEIRDILGDKNFANFISSILVDNPGGITFSNLKALCQLWISNPKE